MKSAVSLLVNHIAYRPFIGKWPTRFRLLSKEWPVYGALVEIGLPAVPFLLAEMKKTLRPTSPEESGSVILEARKKAGEFEDIIRKPFVLALCLEKIYGQAGHGKLLARKRLELEIAATKDPKEKTNLQRMIYYFEDEDSESSKKKGEAGPPKRPEKK